MFIPNCNWLPYYLREQNECNDYKPLDSVDKVSNELDELYNKNMEYLQTVSDTYSEVTNSLKKINKNYDSCLDSLKDIKEGMKTILEDLRENTGKLEVERYEHEL